MDELVKLAAKVEAADGPDRELDAAIAAAVRYFPPGVGFVWKAGLIANSPEAGRVECATALGTGGPHYSAKHYTASVDAALLLVPDGWHRSFTDDPDDLGGVIAELWTGSRNAWANAATPALAICVAALRAKAGA
jgi:hypothetical protein